MIRPTIHAIVWAYRHATGKLRAPELAVISQYLKPDSICIDVGAHGGAWSQGLARVVTNGHVYAFEALPYYADVLKKTLKLLGQKRVTVLNCAVGEKDGTLQIAQVDMQGNKLTGKTHVAACDEQTQLKCEVSATTLDSFWRRIDEKQVDFVKCDVEGFELFVLQGATALIDRCRPVFFNELNTEWCDRYAYTPKKIFNFFSERDYVPFYIDPQAGLADVDLASHVDRDVLFLPRERLG